MRFVIPAILLITSGTSLADAYVDAGKPFLEIQDKTLQAEAWAICAASYDLMSAIMDAESPEKAKQLSDLGKGARLAVGMSLIINDLDPDISPEQFELLWTDSRTAMTEWPQTQLNAILADANEFGTERAEEFGKKINATVVNCINNLRGQQRYIDSWQELVKSGLLEIPK